MAKQNWATNINFHDAATFHPKSVDELASLVAASPKIRARGSGHCFNTIADSYNSVVILDQMPLQIEINAAERTVTVSSGLNYAQLSQYLHENGWALHNLASLPHISIAGAVATGTHGSGIRNGALHTAVISAHVISADGSLRVITETDSDFYAAIVGLGLTGIVCSYVLRIEPTYEIKQVVYGDVPRSVVGPRLVELLSGGYNTNYFTEWDNKGVGDIWFKSRETPADTYMGAHARNEKVHPILSEDPEACSEQLGIPGPWFNRLPHFRIDANPSAGNELQSEFFVVSSDASGAFAAIESIAPEFGKKLLVSEIRAIAADDHWMSPAYQRESVAFHCTWKNDYEVPYFISLIEDALAPFAARPHLGKLFNVDSKYLAEVYPRFNDFAQYVKSVDPTGKFSNEFTEALF